MNNTNIIIVRHEFLDCDTYIVSTQNLKDDDGNTFYYKVVFSLEDNEWYCTKIYEDDAIGIECPAELLEQAKKFYIDDDKSNVYHSIVDELRRLFDTSDAIDIASNIYEEVYDEITDSAVIRYNDSDIRLAMARVLFAVTGIGKD